jgi:hypothetical protein
MNLSSTFVVVNPDLSAVPVALTPTIYEELDRRFQGFKGRVLVSCYRFDSHWESWEMHPAGDEIVVAELTEPGSFVIVPRGTWHTAHTSVPTTMLFVTPGEGTRHKAMA